MATISSFKEIRSWQASKDLAVSCYKLTQELQFKFEFALVNQMRKSAISVPSNIAEGFERKGNKEFVQFLFIAVASLGELQTQLIISNEVGFLDAKRLEEYENQILGIKKMIYGMVTYLKNSEQKGYKFSEPEVPYGRIQDFNELEHIKISPDLHAEGAKAWDGYSKSHANDLDVEMYELPDEFTGKNT